MCSSNIQIVKQTDSGDYLMACKNIDTIWTIDYILEETSALCRVPALRTHYLSTFLLKSLNVPRTVGGS